MILAPCQPASLSGLELCDGEQRIGTDRGASREEAEDRRTFRIVGEIIHRREAADELLKLVRVLEFFEIHRRHLGRNIEGGAEYLKQSGIAENVVGSVDVRRHALEIERETGAC